MKKIEYINTLKRLIMIANDSDTSNRLQWQPLEMCGAHCQHLCEAARLIMDSEEQYQWFLDTVDDVFSEIPESEDD